MEQSGSLSTIKYAKNIRRAFVFFSNEHKKTIRKATGLGQGRDGRQVLDLKVYQAWQHLAPEHRARYNQMEQADRLRYKSEIAAGLPFKRTWKTKVIKRSPKSPQACVAPVKPLSQFLLFSSENCIHFRNEAREAGLTLLKLGSLAKHIGKAWKALPEEERKHYHDRAAAAAAQYYEKMAAYKQGLVETAKKQSAAVAKLSMPKMFVGAYMRFMSANRARVKAASAVPMNANAISRALAEEWKQLSPEEKQPFEAAAAVDSARYREEMAARRIARGPVKRITSTKSSKKSSTAAPKVKKLTKDTKA